MASFFKKKREYGGKKGYLAVPEYMYGAPFADIMACMDPMHLEDSVVSEFDHIFCSRNIDDYRYLRLYPGWMKVLSDNLQTVMISYISELKDYKKLITFFPEFAKDIYEFLIEEYIHKDDFEDKTVGKEIDIVNDVLIPISDLERYQGQYFSIVRQADIEILDACDTYAEMWDVLWAYETYFGIPREHYKPYLLSVFLEFIRSYDEHDCAAINFPAIYDEDDFECIKDFIRDEEAYNYLMDNLPWLIISSGLDFYTMMIKILGPVKEVVDLHDYCAEFISSTDFGKVLLTMLQF